MLTLVILKCLFIITTVLESQSRSPGYIVDDLCPEQPSELLNILKHAKEKTSCIFKQLKPDTKWAIQSELVVREAPGVPDSQGWSICKHCAWIDGEYIAFSNRSDLIGSQVQLSWSYWGEFFIEDSNDQIVAHIRKPLLPSKYRIQPLYIDRPVFVLPFLTLHVGHVLVDCIEQIYTSMMQSYGEVRKDSLIILDVANKEERRVLQDNLLIHSQVDIYGRLFQMFSDLPILSMNSFIAIQNQVSAIIFQSIHVGLDSSKTFFQRGHWNHPCSLKWPSKEFEILSKRSIQFQTYVKKELNIYDDSSITVAACTADSKTVCEYPLVNVVFVQRSSNRVIVNLKDLISAVTSNNTFIMTKEINLEKMAFSEQLDLFSKTDILVAVAGTALHNVLFMPAGSTVVIIMQPGWCKWAWMYANQAALLRVHYLIYCSQPKLILQSNSAMLFPFTIDDTHKIIAGTNSFHWSRRVWELPPSLTKADDVIVEVDTLSDGIKRRSRDLSSVDDSMCLNELVDKSIEPHAILANNSIALKGHVPVLEVYVSNITAKRSDNGIENISIYGEIAARGKPYESFVHIMESMNQLSVCFSSLFFDPVSSCSAVHRLHYYSHLLMKSVYPVHHFHLWLQAAQGGGKIAGSDIFVVIDTRVGSDTGLSVHTDIVGSMISVTDTVKDILLSAKSKDFFDLNVAPFHFISTRFSLQRYTADLCFLFQLSQLTCVTVAQLLTRTAYFIVRCRQLQLPAMQLRPTKENPFISLQIEDIIDDTLTEGIVKSVHQLNLTAFVPCHLGLPCDTYLIESEDLPKNLSLSEVSVMAGKFAWGVWNDLPSLGLNSHPPSCLIIGRHPVLRTISYYYRYYFSRPGTFGYGRRLNELTVEEMHHLVVFERQGIFMNNSILILDEGISDSACRALVGLKATTGRIILGDDSMTLPPPLSDIEVALALNNIEKCVVGMLDSWQDTVAVVKQWFPWLKLQTLVNSATHSVSGQEIFATLRPDLLQVIEKMKKCDMVLYDKMLALFMKQLLLVKDDSFVDEGFILQDPI